MTVSEYGKMVSAFADAFGDDVPFPAWRDCKPLELASVLKAIDRVAADPMSKWNNCIAQLVLDAEAFSQVVPKRGGTKRRSLRTRAPCCPRPSPVLRSRPSKCGGLKSICTSRKW